MYRNKTVSLVLPAYNEEASIVQVIKDFLKTGVVDEIIVVDNNSKDATVELARKTKKVKVVQEKKQGYGYAIWKGLKVARGDLLVTCDADNTYRATDIKRLLARSSNYDFVWATRVDKKYLLKGSNMGILRRTANRAISFMITLFFKGPPLTDLGATFRVLNRKPYQSIRKHFKTGGGNFQPELTILALKRGYRIIEVPVYYGARTGTSKISGSFADGVRIAFKMIGVILGYKFKS